MTRKEQIKKQADIYTDDASNYTEWSDDGGWSGTNDIDLVEKAFIEGAKWADEHPKSPWISVKDDLPCNNSYLTSSVCTDDVIVYECGKIYNSYMRMDVNNEWYWAKGKPKYWMPIPELPKE